MYTIIIEESSHSQSIVSLLEILKLTIPNALMAENPAFTGLLVSRYQWKLYISRVKI